MADNLEPRVSDLEQRADSADKRTDNLEIRVSKLEGKIARDRRDKISKKQFSELGSKVALNQQKITKITNILKAKGTAKKEGTIASLSPETGKNTLIQINESLVSIKEQLELDYSSRINKEKRDLKNAQKAADLKKKQQKEKDVEALKKVGGAIGGIVGKIGAPIKNVFDKILGFFGALVGGFIINQALKPENIERIKAIFDGIAKNWGWVVGIAGGVLIAGVVRKLVTLFRAVRAIGRFVTGGAGRGRRPRGSRVSPAEQRFRRRFGDRAGNDRFGKKPRGGLIRNASGGVRNNIVAKSITRVQDIASQAGSKVVSKLGLKGITKFLRPLLKRVPIFGGLIDFAVSLALGEPIGRAAAKSVGAMLGSALGSLVPIPFFGTVAGGIFGDIVGGKIYDFITGAKNEENNKESAEMNTGGKVAGNELGPNKDSVSAMLTPGEFVINRDATNLWGISTLAAMNSTSGEMYNVIQKTFESQIKNNLEFEKANIEFAKVLSSLSEVMTNKKPPTMSSGGGGGGGASAAKITPSSGGGGGGASKLKPPAKRKGSGVTMMPPQKQTTMTSLGGDQPKPAGDSIPVLGAEDPSNFFIGFMKEQLGIFGA